MKCKKEDKKNCLCSSCVDELHNFYFRIAKERGKK